MIGLKLIDLVLRLRTAFTDDRGDVPGWVLITVMTAAIAMVLWGLAQGTFQDLFSNAFSSVGPTSSGQ